MTGLLFAMPPTIFQPFPTPPTVVLKAMPFNCMPPGRGVSAEPSLVDAIGRQIPPPKHNLWREHFTAAPLSSGAPLALEGSPARLGPLAGSGDTDGAEPRAYSGALTEFIGSTKAMATSGASDEPPAVSSIPLGLKPTSERSSRALSVPRDSSGRLSVPRDSSGPQSASRASNSSLSASRVSACPSSGLLSTFGGLDALIKAQTGPGLISGYRVHSTMTEPKSSRLCEYLVTESEMIVHNFPTPTTDVGYRPTKADYVPVDDASPLFALDCEMCVTIDWRTGDQQSELTRVSLTNEQGEVILDTLVRPHYPIVDYVTYFSGITEEMMNDVTTRLVDVQAAVAAALPRDAVLVGHSLNCDLRALQMSHPYCIDTSLLYNFTGDVMQRSSLRQLAAVFLGRQIQAGRIGHCSVEDSAVALQLARLKIVAGPIFGNVFRGYRPSDLSYFTANSTFREMKRSGTHSNLSIETDSDSDLSDSLPSNCVECGRMLHVNCSNEMCPCWDRKRSEFCVHCLSLYANNNHLLNNDTMN